MTRTRGVVAALAFLACIAPDADAQPYAYVLIQQPVAGTAHSVQKVAVFNTATNTLVDTITTGQGCLCDLSDAIAATPDGSRVYVANYVDSSVSVIDARTGGTLPAITANVTTPTALATSPDGAVLYVLNGAGDAKVLLFDATTNAYITSIPVGNPLSANHMTLKPDGTRLYVSTYDGNTIKVIDTASRTVIATIPGGTFNATIVGMDVSPDGSILYAVNRFTSIGVYDATTNTFTGTAINFPPGTVNVRSVVRFGPAGTRAYGVSGGLNTRDLLVFNGQTHALVQTIPLTTVGNMTPGGLEVAPDGAHVYVAMEPISPGASVLKSVSTADNTVLSYPVLPLGYPAAIVIAGGPSPPVLKLNNDTNGDVFVYSPSSGIWASQYSVGGGGFVGPTGVWGPNWTVTPAKFNDDAFSDLFLFSPTNGQWFKMLNNGAGVWTSDGFGAWGTHWQRFVGDLNLDGVSDVFLWDPVRGQWFKCLSTPGGFTYEFGYWSPGWEVYPMRFFNNVAFGLPERNDFFLFNRSSGQWFWAAPTFIGFTYPQSGAWSTVWQFYPGDYNGDDVTDLLLHNPANGQFFVATSTAYSGSSPGGFSYRFGSFSVGWNIYPMDLDNNLRDDLFLHNPATGQWFKMLGSGVGSFFAFGSGAWSPGWTLYPAQFDDDGRADLLLYNQGNGQWFQAKNVIGGFSYTMGFWSPGVTVVTTPPK